MKKISTILKRACLIMLCLTFAITIGQAQTVVFQEDFSGFADSTSSDISGNLDDYTSISGWTGTKVYPSTYKIKLGASSTLGWIQTPAIDLSADNGNFTLSFDAEAWKNDNTNIKVYVNNDQYTVSGLDNDGSYGSYQHFSLELTGGTANTHIKFEGNQASKGRFFLDNLLITQSGGVPAVSTPTFSTPSGLYMEPFDVSLTCEEESASIYYTLDGTTPDSTSILYDGGLISVSQTTVLKAIAYAEGFRPSSVASATYTFPVDVDNIADFLAANTATSNTIYRITNDVVFVFNSGANYYVQDETGGLLVYDQNNVITSEYESGDIISGGIVGTYKLYNGLSEMIASADMAESTENIGEIEPISATIEDIITDYELYESRLVRLENVIFPDGGTYTTSSATNLAIIQGDDTMQCRNNFKTLDTTIAEGYEADVTGFILRYVNNNSTSYQISPRYNTDITASTPTAATPVITPVSGTYADSVVVSISCETEGAEIRYTLDGEEPTDASLLYEEPFTLTTNATVMAKAFMNSEEWYDSEIAEAEYTIAHEAVLSVNPEELEFSSDALTGEITISGAFLTEDIILTVDDEHFALSHDTIPADAGNTTVTVTFDGTEPAYGLISITSGEMEAFVTLTATAQVPTPVFTPASGTIDTLIEVAMTCTLENAVIYYTTDGSEPTTESDIYMEPITLNVPGTYTFNAIAMAEGWESSEMVTATYTVPEPIVPSIDTIVYRIGFEASEGFAASTTYNNPEPAYTGPEGQQWATVYGTPTTTDHICGDQSLQMRWYTSAPEMLGYTTTNFDIRNVTYVTFSANNNGALNVTVSYSIDGGNTFVGDSVITLTSNARNYRYNVSETGEFNFVRLKFAVSLPSTTPTGTNRLTIDSVVVFGVPGIVADVVEAPVIAPNSGLFFDDVEVSMTCATEGAEIRYTLDGSNPDENSTIYTEPFTISGTTTVKAKAWKEGMTASNITTTTYNFPVEVADIAAFKAATSSASNTVYKITGDVTFVYENGSNFYIQDATGGLLIYDNQNVITSSYEEGDVISGGVVGTCTYYNGLRELVPSRNLAGSSENTGTVAPMAATIEDIINEYDQYESRLVRLESVNFVDGGEFATGSASNMEIVQDDETMVCRSNFKTLDMTIDAGAEANVVGFVSIYSNNSGTDFQIFPRTNADIELISTGINTLDNNTVVYPNPANQTIHVNAPANINRIELYSVTGQKVADYITDDSQAEIGIAHLATGLYIMKIYTNDGIASKKFNIAR